MVTSIHCSLVRQQAEICDSQNGGAGTTNSYTFDGYTGTFYGPSTSNNSSINNFGCIQDVHNT